MYHQVSQLKILIPSKMNLQWFFPFLFLDLQISINIFYWCRDDWGAENVFDDYMSEMDCCVPFLSFTYFDKAFV